MPTSTSRRNALVEALRCGAILFALSAWLIGAIDATAMQLSDDDLGGLPAGNDELRRATPLILSALRDQPDLPEAAMSVSRSQKPPRWSSNHNDKRLLASFNFHYRGATNSYCRLVTLAANLRSAELVPLSPSANTENCAGVASVLYVDLNGDGIVDVIQGLRVKSNRYNASVITAVVYLSDAKAKSGYCYSEQASRHLPASELRSAAVAKRAIESERARLSISKFECSK